MTDIKSGTPAKGTHGILRNASSGVEIPVTQIDGTIGQFYVRVDGSNSYNTFYETDGWTFTPDKPALPTEPGFYRPEKDSDWNGGYLLSIDYRWFRISSFGTVDIKDPPFTPLVFLG